MNGLTTHILDLTHGHPASSVKIEIRCLSEPVPKRVRSATTNEDGRLDAPLLPLEEMKPGEYELLFYIGDYFRSKGMALDDPPFLDKVAVRIGVADGRSHYHVPLLISPWGYQVYRGS